MLNKTEQSRRQAPRNFSVSQDGTWGMYMSLLQRVNEFTRRFIPASVARTSTIVGCRLATLLIAVAITIPAFAQHQLPGDIDYTIPRNSQTIPDYSGSINTQPARGVGGYGFMGRVGHEAGDAVGRKGSLSYIDLSPFSFHGDTIFFGDGRLYAQNNGKMGGSAGLGIRHFFSGQNAIFGSTFSYDHDASRGVTFEQFTIANEILTEFFDIRANIHIPFGNKQQVTAVLFEPGTERFVDAINPGTGDVQGSNISFQSRTFSSAALEGVDLTISTPIHGTVAERYNLEASAGAYHYQARGLNMEKITGFKLRMDGDFFDNLSHLFLEVTKDSVFNTNIVFGADLNYWQHLERQPRLRKSQFSRMASWVRRTRTVSTFDSSSLNAAELAINPIDGDPYLIYHVRNNPALTNFPAPIGNGSELMPFQFIQEGIDAGPFADIVFVHANSVFDGVIDGNANATAVLRDDILVLGEGVPLTIPVTGIITEIDLPTVTLGPLTRPTLQNVTGPVVTLADNSRFAGFQILNYADGPAILANGIDTAEVNELIIGPSTGVLGSGIEINNTAGTFVLENIAITGTSGDAFSVTGGTANIVFNGDNTITNSSGFSALIRDARGSVNMRGVTIMDDGGAGILVEGTTTTSSTANVTFDTAILTNTVTAREGAFEVRNHAGGVSVLNDLIINTPGTGGISILELQPTGSVVFQGASTITNRNGRGLFIRDIAEGPSPIDPLTDIAGTVNFQDTLTIAGFGLGAGVAIDMSSSSGSVTLQDIMIIGDATTNTGGSAVAGINISDLADTGITTGQFVVNGQTTLSDIQGSSINIQNIAKEDFLTIFNGVTINNRGIAGNNIVGTGVNITGSMATPNRSITRFLGTMLIDNQFGTTTPAVNVVGNFGDVGFNAVDVANAVGLALDDVAVRVEDNIDPDLLGISNISFASLDVEYLGAVGFNDNAVRTVNNESVEVATGVLEVTNARAITVEMNLSHDLMFESISATNDDFGIIVTDSIGEFGVSGAGNIRGTGGAITGMSIAGAQFDTTQIVNIGFIDFAANVVGIRASNLLIEGNNLSPELIVRGVDIRNSAQEAIEVTDVSDFTLVDSEINSNAGLNQILFTALTEEVDIDLDGNDDAVVYNVNMANNNITDGGTARGGDMILLTTGGLITNGVDLNFNFLDHGVPGIAPINSINSSRPGDAALIVNWTGDSQIVIDSNTFLLTNANLQTGVELDIDGVADVTFTNNNLRSAGVSDVGIEFTFQESTNLVVSNNAVVDVDGFFTPGSGFIMSGDDSTAMSLSFFSGGNNIEIDNNIVEFNGFGNTGIVFERIFAPSNVAINNNLIVRRNTAQPIFTPLEEGIVFRDVRGVINLNGNVNNTIQLNSIFFINFGITPGTSNGQIIVNGVPLP